jgi:undecaprenyl-diphosphatase
VRSARRRQLYRLAGAFILLAALGWIAGEASEAWATPADRQLLAALDAHQSHGLTAFATALTTLGSAVVVLPLGLVAIVLLSRLGRLDDAIFIGVAVIGTIALLYLVKDLVDRSRPVIPHLVGTRSASFPSAHAGQSVAFYGALALVLGRRRGRRLRILCWSLAALVVLGIGWSRLYLGVHYPSDVLGGYALAAGWLIAGAVTLRDG